MYFRDARSPWQPRHTRRASDLTNKKDKVDTHAIPVRTSKPLPLHGIDPSMQFLIERLDGVSSVQELAWMNGIPVDRLRLEMARLLGLGVVEIEGARADLSSRITTQSDVIDLTKLKEAEAAFVSSRNGAALDGRTSTREVSKDEQEEHARLLEDEVELENLDEEEPLSLPVIDQFSDLPVPLGWPREFATFHLHEKWEHLAEQIDPALLRIVTFYLLHLGEVSHYKLLQVPADASEETVRDAADGLRAFFDVGKWWEHNEADIIPAIQRIRRAIGQAESILVDENSRAQYNMALDFLNADQ